MIQEAGTRIIEKLAFIGIFIIIVIIALKYYLPSGVKETVEKISNSFHTETVILPDPDILKTTDEESNVYNILPSSEEEIVSIKPIIIPPIPTVEEFEQFKISGINWLSGKCATFGYNVLNIVQLAAKPKIYGILPNPMYERWYDAAEQIRVIIPNSGCDVTEEEIRIYLLNLAETTYKDNEYMRLALRNIGFKF